MSKPISYDNLDRSQLLGEIQELNSLLNEQVAFSGSDQYRELFERSADAILIIAEDTFVDCNQATVDMLRYQTKDELLLTHPSELSPEQQPDGQKSFEKANEMIAIALEKGSHRFEWEHLRADGSPLPVEVLLTPVKKKNRTTLHVVWRDITERKRLEADLRQSQKMEAMGQLTGGIAHDFNNLLVAILGYADLLELELPEEGDLKEFAHQIKISGERAALLVGQLLAFSRKQVLQPKVIDLNEIITNMGKMLTPLLGENIEFITQLHDQPLFIKADPSQLEQVVVNLVTNGRDAMPRGGSLFVETKLLLQDEKRANKNLPLDPGFYAILSVADTGEGIAKEQLDSIFEPFFTTKSVNEGTGLGLATVHGIIKQSGGSIFVQSELDQGTVFTVYLPLTFERPQAQVDELETINEGRSEKGKTILVVEDEAAVSGLMKEILQREGYRVLMAENGQEAIELVGSLNLEPDLLLTDVIMPVMGGPELARRLAESLPKMKILYSSGYTDDALVVRGELEEGVELIQKPFPPRELILRLSKLLFDI